MPGPPSALLAAAHERLNPHIQPGSRPLLATSGWASPMGQRLPPRSSTWGPSVALGGPLLPVPTSSRLLPSTDTNHAPALPCVASLPWRPPRRSLLAKASLLSQARFSVHRLWGGGLSCSLGQTGVLLPLRPVFAVCLICHNCVILPRLSQQTTGLPGWGPRLSLSLSLTERGAAEGRHWACAEGRTSGWYWTLTSGLRQGDARRCSAKEFGRGRALQKWPQVTLRMSSPRLSRGRTDHVSPGATCSPRLLGARWMAAGSTSREKGAMVPLPQEREARRSPAACPGSRGWPEAGPCPPHVLICECARRQVTPVPGDGGGAHSAPSAA